MEDVRTADRRDFRIIGLIGVAHLFSHLYQLVLPPLFPLIRAEMDISYTRLGALMAVFYVTSGLFQTPAGFLVDRYGARRVLISGLGILAVASTLFGLAPSYEIMLVLAFAGGLGNAVFHPADYALLSSEVSDGLMGRAYSIHNVGGHLGYAVAPALMVALGTAFGWRGALVAAGLTGILMASIMLAWMPRRRPAAGMKSAVGTTETLIGGVRLLLQGPMVMVFIYFVLFSMAIIGLQSFTPTALIALRDLPLATANIALAGFLIGAPAGILAGGVIADRIQAHTAMATSGMSGAGVIILLMGLTQPAVSVMVCMLFTAGFSFGLALPARDLVVRSLTPPGASGKVFGFVYSGLDTGASISPVLFGWFVDIGRPSWIFLCAPILFMMAGGLIFITDRFARPAPRPQAAE